jgi:hypothetical protein
MYKYIGKREVIGRILGENFCLGADRVEVARPLPKFPLIFPKATKEQMKALFEKGYPNIIKEAKPTKNEPKIEKSDSRDDTGLIEDNNLA